ncbi:MAG: elongation factor P maturation arginine rhamnosyltransferase EarP [Burkholderiaceae bacterium]|nr:elongation factor P maturation arginine rhamnosyltransferase EarP [Burkholderiaceae bacterium]
MTTTTLQWDVFCRVIDNFGDIGVCWRLARDLAARGQTVRLWLDDSSALAWMAPNGAPGIELRGWPVTLGDERPGDVVIEAFGCELPEAFLQRMAQRQQAPVWINLEYLSAEPYVERSHRLRSPQFSGPAAGLDKWFFYPGFTARTGGLLREPGLMAEQAAFDREAWLAGLGLRRAADERVVTLFCYDNPGLPALLAELAERPCLLLVTAGAAARQVQALLGPELRQGRLRAHLLPLLSQPEFDHLLWASDLNLVRGEDSFVRAQWAGKPFIWQIYPQHDEAHAAKLGAFLSLYLAATPDAIAARTRALWRAWNGLQGAPAQGLGAWSLLEQGQEAATQWRQQLLIQADLSSQLLSFVANPG